MRERLPSERPSPRQQVDDARNNALVGTEGRMDAKGSRVELWVIPTDEELLIARGTWRVVTGGDPQG